MRRCKPFSAKPEAGSFRPGMQSDEFDSVIIALPAPAAAQVLRMASPELSAELAAIQYSSSITVGLGYDRDVRAVASAGIRISRAPQRRQEAAGRDFRAQQISSPRSRRSRPAALLFRGKECGRCLALSATIRSSESCATNCSKFSGRRFQGLRAEPLFARVYRWKSAMAQYGVGHLDRLDRIERLRQQLPGLALAGNAYRGIGVPDCVRSGRDAAKAIVGCRLLALRSQRAGSHSGWLVSLK